MKLSTKGRYGVRLMLDLAMHQSSRPVLLKDISRRQEVSEKYLWQLINPLKNSGLIVSTRGANGGYKLGRPAKNISLKDIILVLENGMCLVDCVGNSSGCKRSAFCVTRDVWKLVADKILKTLESLNLEELALKQESRSSKAMYAI